MSAGSLRVIHIGGPTVLLQLGGLSLLVDPTFDPPGEVGSATRTLTKLRGPALEATALPPLDAVLLSHDQHADNLDAAGRAVLATAPIALTTPLAAERLGQPARALEPWESVTLVGETSEVTVTAVPARHGPIGSEPVIGPVTGFVLTGDGLPTVYVSGDNSAPELVEEIAARVPPVDVAVLFAGAARTPSVDGALTLTATDAVAAARAIGAPVVVPVHTEGWAHFSESTDDLVRAFAAAGLGALLRVPERGIPFEI
ncbi:MBL fold metallo-hydrolase [Microbacterium sp. SCN 71-21]|uniref:MBL fold metallo-hydrolase n=1 Tax=Microbacterium sp. SCN 71-21 TaxID=1660116 RepID=UPI000ADB3C8C|nr:MBL fold metallo-hydrolase [Microbacterium sp. SCN 71-21]